MCIALFSHVAGMVTQTPKVYDVVSNWDAPLNYKTGAISEAKLMNASVSFTIIFCLLLLYVF